VGYEADAAVVAYVAQHDLGCTVDKKDLKEEIAWQGFGTGEVDAILENWGHDDLKKKYITEQKTAVEAGSTGNKGIIGWFVPPWLAKAHPDITDWQNLNKYADKFKDSWRAAWGLVSTPGAHREGYRRLRCSRSGAHRGSGWQLPRHAA
jgi:glycine betaine/proline transport system substrate-binding protein